MTGRPDRRTLLRVGVNNRDETDRAIQTLMGRDVGPRFEFITARAPRVDEVDV